MLVEWVIDVNVEVARKKKFMCCGSSMCEEICELVDKDVEWLKVG